jgi:hypothetical protein
MDAWKTSLCDERPRETRRGRVSCRGELAPGAQPCCAVPMRLKAGLRYATEIRGDRVVLLGGGGGATACVQS